MKVEDYDDFCEKVIRPYTNQLLEYAKKENCAQFIKLRPHSLKRIYTFYQKKRDIIKRYYMKPPAKALDRHKVASCMLYAILRSKVFRINKLQKQLPYKILMANEYLGVYVAVNIIEQYKIDELGKEYNLIFPTTYHETENNTCVYLDNLCKGLYYIKAKNLDIFSYSTIFFFMEKYTDTLLEYKNKNKQEQKISLS